MAENIFEVDDIQRNISENYYWTRNNTTYPVDDTEQLRELFETIYKVVVPIIVIVGFFGNAASIAAFTSRYLKRHSSSVFLFSLAFVDNIFLITLSMTWYDHTISNILTTMID